MICLDCNTAIAAFQSDPAETIAIYRDRVRYFLNRQGHARILFPSVALSEYLWRADRQELEESVRQIVGERMFCPPFDEITAGIAASLGRRYFDEMKKVSDVARVKPDRVVLRADLLIVATALQHGAQHFLTNDDGCLSVARFTKLITPVLIRDLPDPPPPSPPPDPKSIAKQLSLFEEFDS